MIAKLPELGLDKKICKLLSFACLFQIAAPNILNGSKSDQVQP